MLVVLQKKKASNDPEYLKLYVDTEEAQLIREGKFYGKKQPDWAENPVHTPEDGRQVEKEPVPEEKEQQPDEEKPAESGRPQCPIRKKNRFRTKRSKDKSRKTNVESPFAVGHKSSEEDKRARLTGRKFRQKQGSRLPWTLRN